MAHLRDNYLKSVASGEIVLPEYTTMLGSVVLHYKEVFCRVKDCYKAIQVQLRSIQTADSTSSSNL
ncbi:hypothetical protein CIRG_05010 [Coccidioides immitis RMSCC 2394]|uniref:Uncharacterized protein n=1 Tax=Coccidioides immitis RMSCC 2394 TaxID=404692 RepID=A0A0J6YE56_COCIT|nr:hypothetical protein CIRG_05010 [Coccidioides immitis RMSCC 2394]